MGFSDFDIGPISRGITCTRNGCDLLAPWPLRSPAFRGQREYTQGFLHALSGAFLEVAFDAPHLIRDVCQAQDGPLTSFCKGI